MGACSTKDTIYLKDFVDFTNPLIAQTLLTLNANKANYSKESRAIIAALTAAYMETQKKKEIISPSTSEQNAKGSA